MAFNASLHTATNKPIGLIGKPVDARSYYYDTTYFKYRPYVTTAEALAYLDTASIRAGQFPIIINSDGTLSNGVITGGANAEWWFRDGVLDANLIFKSSEPTSKTTLTLEVQDVEDSGGDIPVNGVTLSGLDGVIEITYSAALIAKHGNTPSIQVWHSNQMQTIAPILDDQSAPTTLTIGLGTIPGTQTIIILI